MGYATHFEGADLVWCTGKLLFDRHASRSTTDEKNTIYLRVCNKFLRYVSIAMNNLKHPIWQSSLLPELRVVLTGIWHFLTWFENDGIASKKSRHDMAVWHAHWEVVWPQHCHNTMRPITRHRLASIDLLRNCLSPLIIGVEDRLYFITE